MLSLQIGFILVVVTNQSCVAYGHVTKEVVAEVHEKMQKLLKEEADVQIDGVYCSYHSPNAVISEYKGMRI